MRKNVIYIMLMLLSVRLDSQEVYQQTTIELNDVLDGNVSYQCQATRTIELSPGFAYKPVSGNGMSLEIDRYSVFPPMEGVYGGNDGNEECVVGSIPGVLNVGTTGAATYSVDIQLPPALGGMIPKLTIAYNNQSANGLLGWSWDLLGLSAIERVGQTEYHDGKITSVDFVNDRYAVDGQRLMSVGDNEYKTEVDNFDKIVSYNGNKKGPDYFVIWKSDGTIWEYGTTEDSKIESQFNDKVILKWLLSRIVDRNGNAITYNYYENVITGESYIKNIEYTSNEKANVRPAYSVRFLYEDRIDSGVTYICGNSVADSKILKSIEVVNNYSGKKIVEYSLEYDAPGLYDKDYYLHYRLNSIYLEIDGKKVNPTRIVWNSEDKFATENSCGYKKYELDKSVFDKVSFVGDFNGDGFSDVLLLPYKIQDTYTSDVDGEIYLNNGDGSFAPFTKYRFDKNLDWIYVFDINGDGVDDVVPYEIHYDNTGAFDMVKISILIMSDRRLVNRNTYTYENAVALYPGNYWDRSSCGLLVVDMYNGKKNKDLVRCIYYKNESFVETTIQNSNVINGKDVDCLVMDMSGDGLSEVLSLGDDGYNVYRINADDFALEQCGSGSNLTKKIFLFPNDYNGDGKVDLLYYDPAKFWNMVFSTGDGFSESLLCVRNNLLRNVRLNDRDKYRYSLREMQKPTVAIRTADFDGDGVADVGVFNSYAGNYYLEIGFLPYEETSSSCSFKYCKRYNMPINYSHQTIQLGRFLPQENTSILSGLPRDPSSFAKAYVASLCPNSAYYSVEKIVDGMGNSTELSYDYLIYDGKSKDAFYTCIGGVNSNGVEKKSLPILALKELKTYSVNGKPIVKRYNYKNALLHKKGHGFLGFENVVVRNYVDGNLIDRQLLEYSMEPMGASCMPVLMSDKLYHGETQLIKEHYFEYKKYRCVKNAKVVAPLLLRDREAVYDVDRRNVVLKNIITTNDYESDIASSESYDRVVRLKITKKGFDNVKSIDPEQGQYVEEVRMSYEDDVVNWIVNRPVKITKSMRDRVNPEVGDVSIMEYDTHNPMLVAKETMIPNVKADASDSLTLIVKYKYDNVGNMTERAISSPSLKFEKIVKSEYGDVYQYRYKTKSIDELGREVVCKYDEDFGILEMTTDYNGLTTCVEQEPFGVKSVVTTPDRMKNVKVLRWSNGNEYAPENSAYYSWEKSVGGAEKMVFYHKSGVELRSVTFDINGKAVCVDKVYDDYGNLEQESYPYYEDEGKVFVRNIYDSYNRMVETAYPNGLNVSRVYEGNDVTTEYLTSDGMKRCKKESYNVMGWMSSAVDYGGGEVLYEYYSDGMLKSAQVAENKVSTIYVTYDNRRNKTSVNDPNCGLMSYKNDALGNVVEIVNAQNVIEIEYDILGRMVSRLENNTRQNTRNLVRWEYARTKGRDGVLQRIVSQNHQLEYEYDANLRVRSVVETINGTEYKTKYSYDEASRVTSISYPSGFTVRKQYSDTGYEKAICDASNRNVLWKAEKTDPNGYITEFQLGNGLKSQYSYNPYSNVIENIVTKKGDDSVQDLVYEYDGFGNLTSRCDMKDYNYEEFQYDAFDRLTQIILNGEVKGRLNYYKNGNICDKEVDGVKVLYNTMYATVRPNAIVSMNSDDDKMYDRFSQNISYSLFDNVSAIDEKDKSLSMVYGYDNSRIFMQCNVGGKLKNKTYVGNCEYIEEDGSKKVLTYLEGPTGVFAVHVSDGEESINYVLKDNLGSWNVVTDEHGNQLEKLSFDAWGNIRNPEKWEEDIEDKEMLFDRGFTGHEHLWDFGLIHMNGRLYDPLMSMMLSPDNNIQIPQSSQNFNRYSYCLNNPLKYYDPTGEWVESVVFGIVGGAANLVFNARNIDSFGEAALLFGVGFVKGFLTEITMGQSWFLQVGVGAITEGLVAGTNRMVSVGDGSFEFSGDDWNSIKTSSHYGLGSGLVKSFMYAYTVEPTESQYGESFFESCYNKELAHSMTSLVAHGAGCWFSGQPFLSTLGFKDLGFDLKMLGVMAKRLMSSYIYELGFGEKALDKRASEIKDAILRDMLEEMPDTPDFGYKYELSGVFIEDGRLYVVGNIFEMIPGELIEAYPKPYMEEVITFPFSYSLFKTLFFNK